MELILEHKGGRSRYSKMYRTHHDSVHIIDGESQEGDYYETDLREVTKIYIDLGGTLIPIWEGDGLVE